MKPPEPMENQWEHLTHKVNTKASDHKNISDNNMEALVCQALTPDTD